MDKATKFVLIPFRDFRLLTCKRKINSKGRISGIVKEIELSDDENEIKKSKKTSRLVNLLETFFYLLDPPQKGAPITRARIKSLLPKNAEKILKTSTTPTKSTRQTKPIRTNLSSHLKSLKNPANQKKQSESDVVNHFTDLSYPTGYQ